MKASKIFPNIVMWILSLALVSLLSCDTTTVITGPATTYYYSPISAIGVGPNGLPTKKIDVKPYCCPTTAIEITSSTGATDDDLQWVEIPLSVRKGTIKSVTVCYNVKTTSPGRSFISQVRLAKMTTPSSALVLHDDGTNLTSTTPTCYTSNTNVKVDGTITLSLRVAVAASDAIQVGGITLEME